MRRSYRPMVFAFLVAIVAGVGYLRWQHSMRGPIADSTVVRVGCVAAATAFRRHDSGTWMSISARILRALPDATGGRTHQRFIVSCASGQTILVVNDTSIGMRVPVQKGATIAIRGQYIWNSQGGLLHFTHHNDNGGTGGWIQYRGMRYSLAPSIAPGHAAAEHDIATGSLD